MDWGWGKPLAGLDIVEKTETKIREIRRVAQIHQQQYANKRWKTLEFKVVDMMMLKVSTLKGVIHFSKNGSWVLDILDLYKSCRESKKLCINLINL